MSSADYREARGPSCFIEQLSEDELRQRREAHEKKKTQGNQEIDELLHIMDSDIGKRVPIADAVARYRGVNFIINSDRWIVKHIQNNRTLIRLLDPRKEKGRWTVNGSMLDHIKDWMWDWMWG
jgi:hypothetical protein